MTATRLSKIRDFVETAWTPKEPKVEAVAKEKPYSVWTKTGFKVETQLLAENKFKALTEGVVTGVKYGLVIGGVVVAACGAAALIIRATADAAESVTS